MFGWHTALTVWEAPARCGHSRREHKKNLIQAMKTKTPLLLVTMLSSVLLGAGSAFARDMTLNDCPVPVQEAVRAHSQGGRFDEVKTVTVNGRTLYVVEIDLSANRDLKLHITSDGTVVKSREEITLAQLPAAVRTAVQGMVPAGATIDDIDKEVSEGKTTYLVEIDRPNSNDLKIVFAEDGTVLSQYGN